ncbi:MAG: hypothetical protein ABEJ03_06045 [Candidatus Nanohaloarchaea archaeon]
MQLGFISGSLGGFVAMLAMTAAMKVLSDHPVPPTADLWSKYIGDEPPEECIRKGMMLHLLYGTAAGALFATALPSLGYTELGALALVGYSILYGLVLELTGSVVWVKAVMGMESDRSQIVNFTAFHLVYGLVLGLWLALVPL